MCVPAHEPANFGSTSFRNADRVHPAGGRGAGDYLPAGTANREGSGARAGTAGGIPPGVRGGGGSGAVAANVQVASAGGVRRSGCGVVPLLFSTIAAGLVPGVFCGVCHGLSLEPEAGDVPFVRTADSGGSVAAEPVYAGGSGAGGVLLPADFRGDVAGLVGNGVPGRPQPEVHGAAGIPEPSEWNDARGIGAGGVFAAAAGGFVRRIQD